MRAKSPEKRRTILQAAVHEIARPDDISVVGYDDILLSACNRPGLTTVNVPRDQVANAAFLSLLSYAQGADMSAVGQEHVVVPKLVCRRSTAAATGHLTRTP